MTSPSSPLGSVLLLAGAAALLLPPPAAAAALAVLALLWWSAGLGPGRWLIGLGLAATAALLAAGVVMERSAGPRLTGAAPVLEEGYANLWREIAAQAKGAAAELPELPSRDRSSRAGFALFERRAFELFESRSERSGIADLSLLLFDPDGEAVAWAGEGFLHEPDPLDLPLSGLAWRQGQTSATLLAVEPLSTARRPWRLVAGRSLTTDRLPFASRSATGRAAVAWPFAGSGMAVQWWLAPASAAIPAGALRVLYEQGPALVVTAPAADLRSELARRLGVAAKVLLGWTLLALPILRLAGPRGARSGVRSTPLLAMAGVALWSSAAGWTPAVAGLVGLTAGLACWAVLSPRQTSLRDGGGELWGGAGVLLLVAGAWFFQDRFGRVDLASELGGSGRVFALRFALCAASLGVLRLAARRLGPARGDRAAWAALAFLSAGAACHDLPLAALPLLAAGGALVARWIGGVAFEERPAAFGGLVILAALAGGLAWETAFREELRCDLAGDYLPELAPPTRAELDALDAELADFFERRDLAEHLLRTAADPDAAATSDRRDLAYVLWRESPLAHRDGLSALVVEPAAGAPSYFTFGLSLADDLDLVRDPARWQVPAVDAWRQVMVSGAVELTRDGRPWGRARYWLLPRPGFRFEVSELSELERTLVRGELHRKAVDGLPPTVLYGLYDPGGRAIVSPWEEAPPLPPAALAGTGSHRRIDTSAGRAWYWSARGIDGIEVLYLPSLEPLAGLQRVGVHTLGTLALLALISALALLFALSRQAFGALVERIVRSYSKRLILVYTLLLLLPLVALNLFLLRGFESRLRREQQADAYEAIGSAGRTILDYVERLEPGLNVATRLNRQYLGSVAGRVHHQVNLYWGSELYASSQPELFTVGLLPERIPGDIYRRLALLGQGTDSRRRQHGEVGYRTYYAPLPVADMSPSLYLSVPVLEQEEEVARELAAMRRRAVLVTTALFCILTAVGSRLARSFTTPIMELIEGTRRIAAGAPFLDVAPRERELSSLADAIDDMAQRIAAGRRQLLLEKQVVERIVENITAAVVSLDHQRRVLLCNRVATELLGAEVGAAIADTLAREERLAGVADFLERAFAGPRQASSDKAPRQETLHLPDAEGESREWTAIYVPLPGPEDPAAILVVDDVTEVVRGQRLEAWAEMARIIAHEIKNPLTPIQLSTEHLRRVFATDRESFAPVLERCVDNILTQVAELREIASEFSIYSRIPKAELVNGDLVDAMQELTDTYRDASKAGVAVDLICELDELPAKFDRKLLGRAMRNLLENALRANAGRGRVTLHLEREGNRALLRVRDGGPGVEPAMLHRIFEPYFSTHESGTGLGLAITRRIVEEHGGRIEARNHPEGGLEVLTTLPLSS